MTPLLRAAGAGRLVVFVGAGASMIPPTALPSWKALNEQVVAALTRRVEPAIGAEAAADAARAIRDRQEANRLPPEYQAELLSRRLRQRYFPVLQCLDSDRPNAVHRRVARLACDGAIAAIVTTNFDRAVEAAFRELGARPRVLTRRAEYAALLPELEQGRAGGRACPLLKLHGSADDPATLVDTLSQRKRGFPAEIRACLRSLLDRCHWLFLGWSGADLDADESYLGLWSARDTARGFTWLHRRSSKDPPRPVVRRICEAYAGRAEIVSDELPGWFESATTDLVISAARSAAPASMAESPAAGASSTAAIAEHTRRWAEALESADCASALYELLVAVSHPQKAVELLRGARRALVQPGSPEDLVLMTELASALGRTGAPVDEAMRLHRDAIAGFEAIGLTDHALQARANLGAMLVDTGRAHEGMELHEAALQRAIETGDDERRSVALHNLALGHQHMGNAAAAERHVVEELRILQDLGDEPNRIIALSMLGNLLRRQDRLSEAETVLKEAIELATRLGDDRRQAMALGNLATVHDRRGDHRAEANALQEILGIFTRLGDAPNRLRTVANLACARIREDRAAETVDALRSARQEAAALGQEEVLRELDMALGKALRSIGDFAGARHQFGAALDAAALLRNPRGEIDARMEQGITELDDRKPERAGEAFKAARAMAERIGDHTRTAGLLVNEGLVAQQLHAWGEADRLLDEARRMHDASGDRAGAVLALLNMGNNALLRGAPEEAVRIFKEARDQALWARLDEALDRARAGLAYALGLWGRVADSIEAFRDADRMLAWPAGRKLLVAYLEQISQVYRSQGHPREADAIDSEAMRIRGAGASSADAALPGRAAGT